MASAWFYYLLPLAISTAFVLSGWTQYRHSRRGGRNPQHERNAGCASLLFVCVGAALGLAVLLTSPTPWARQRIFDHIFRSPPERIERFVIKAGRENQYHPLARSDVVINDRATVRRITEILRSGTEISPNHPHARWTATVEMVTRDGTSYFQVEATTPGNVNGTLVSVGSTPEGGGWHLNDVRADGLERVMEDAVTAAGAR